MPAKVQKFVAEKAALMKPRAIYICDGSQHEGQELVKKCIDSGQLSRLSKYENKYVPFRRDFVNSFFLN